MRSIETREKQTEQTDWLTEEFLTPEDRKQGQKFLIPKQCLFGTKERWEYDYPSERKVKKLQEDSSGMIILLQNPAIIIAIPGTNSLGLFISDGHHRTRYGIRPVVPCLVFEDEVALSIINRENRKNGAHQVSLDNFRKQVTQRSVNAMNSFAATLPEDKYPRVLTHTNDISGLSKYPGIRPY